MKIKSVALCLLALLGAGGCGSSTAKVKTHISNEEVSLSLDRSTIGLGVIKCIRAEQATGNSKEIVGGRSEKEDHEVSQAVRDLIAAFRRNPATVWASDENPKRSARTYLAEEAETLQQFCWPWLAREIRTVLLYG
jgi:hypothetical protein